MPIQPEWIVFKPCCGMNDEVSVSLMDGKRVKGDDAAVPVSSRGLMYGDGCFETFCAYQGQCFKLQPHLDRLKEGLCYLGIDYPEAFHIDAIKPVISSLLEENKLKEKKAIIRLQVWRAGGRGYGTDSRASHYSITCSRASTKPRTLKLATVDIKRVPSEALPAAYKFTNGINYITAVKQATERGADDALMETVDGFVSETTIANIFWMNGKTVYTPSKSCDILPGITRQIVIGLIKDHTDMAISEGAFTIADVKGAQSVWVCNSVKELVPVTKIDETHFPGKGSFFQTLRKGFKQYLSHELMNSN